MELNRIAQLEGTKIIYLVQLPDLFKANWMLKRVNESIIQMPLEHWQG